MQRFGLPKYRLLRKNQEFANVYRHGKRLNRSGFSLIYLANNRECSRLGISVSRKVKGAVVRNRMKRIFRESFRLNQDAYPSCADIVIAIRPDFSLDSPHLITQAVNRLVPRESA